MKEQLDQAQTNHLAKSDSLPKIAIIGIGNEFNGDDAAGVLIVKKLKKWFPSHEKIIFVEGSIAPENHTGVIRKFKPDWIWLIDAAQISDLSGSVHLVDLDNVEEMGANTHRLAPTLFLSYLSFEFDFKPFLFGIVPENIEPFSDVSEAIKDSIEKTSKFFLHWLTNTYNI